VENQTIFKYPGQKFVGIATRQKDNSLKHVGFILKKSGDRRDVSLIS